jgi:RNA polymerase sigma-70 factor (ECF subfamily)
MGEMLMASRMTTAEVLLARYYPCLQKTACQLAMSHPWLDPGDLVQQAYLKALESWPRFEGRTGRELASWLRAIVKNLFRDLLRRRKEAALPDGADPEADLSSPSRQAMRSEWSRILAEAIDGLPEAQRTAVRLHHLEGRPVRETAQIMGRSTPAVAGLLRAGVKNLRHLLPASH